MIETTRPMSAGRAPTQVGIVSIVADGGITPTTITNREVAFPNYPTEAKGYISEGYGLDLSIPTSSANYFNGWALVTPYGETTRTVTSGSDTWDYKTPVFQINVVQGDVVHRPWIGANITLTMDQTTNVYDFVFPGPEVLVSSTSTPQTFTYTFSSADDPTIGAPDYYPLNQMIKEVAGTEYLYSSYIVTGPTTYTRTETINPGFHVTATTPP
jgi:hypothetical protein